ncbi:MAG: hypothetical protein HQ521_09150, partial [Bacteroidetes bacterium]|nr:hypothetical protein [Bacteroidota bacterium]
MKKLTLLILFALAIQTVFSQFICESPTILTSSVGGDDVTLTWTAPIYNQFTVLSMELRENTNKSIDVSPMHTTIEYNQLERDYMDLQFDFPCYDCGGEAGIVSDGSFIYTSMWNN